MHSSWIEKDKQVIWHPYTQHGLNQDPLPIVAAQGSTLEIEGGARLLDAISCWWVNLLGHGHPQIAHAISKQAQTLEHVMFAGFTHPPAIELAETLIQACQERGASLAKVFYSDNGSTAIEIALKMAYQFHQNQTPPETRTRFLALRGSYHGDTFGAMAVGDPDGMHPLFRPLLAPVDFVTPGDLTELEQTLLKNGSSYAAWIVEPLIQGAGGMKTYSPDYLKQGMRLCKSLGIPVIFDEVFTGFYRTGTAFAFEQVGEAPDLLCLSKGITGGFLPLAATLTTQTLFDAFTSENLSQAFLHGHSYTANPISCAAALATWKLLQSEATQAQIRLITEQTQEHLKQVQKHPLVLETRQLGTIGAIELRGGMGYFSKLAPRIRKEAIQRGVLLRPLGNVIYTVPPYCTTKEELGTIFQVISEILPLLGEVTQSPHPLTPTETTPSFTITDV
ncbi:MAG: adenosylmethionine--8-amino-7-oxononanoate transaminase [Bdellovibrionia bacterium]